MSLSQRTSLKLITLYQAVSSTRHRVCRFEPTCSAYAAEALEEYGFWKGWGYALRRLSRCRPGGGWGYDPVPLQHELGRFDEPAAELGESGYMPVGSQPRRSHRNPFARSSKNPLGRNPAVKNLLGRNPAGKSPFVEARDV